MLGTAEAAPYCQSETRGAIVAAGMALKLSTDNARRAATAPACADPHFHVWVDSGLALIAQPPRHGPGQIPRNEMPAVPLPLHNQADQEAPEAL